MKLLRQSRRERSLHRDVGSPGISAGSFGMYGHEVTESQPLVFSCLLHQHWKRLDKQIVGLNPPKF